MNQKSPLEVKIVTLVVLTSLDKKHLESLIADRTYRIDGVERCEAVDPPAFDHAAIGEAALNASQIVEHNPTRLVLRPINGTYFSKFAVDDVIIPIHEASKDDNG